MIEVYFSLVSGKHVRGIKCVAIVKGDCHQG